MIDVDDPRVRMAAERTLLAWIRTALAMMGLGFAEARHGIPAGQAMGIGLGMVLIGTIAAGFSALEYARLFRKLDAAAAGNRSTILAVWFAGALAVVGVVLVGALLFGATGR